jgi:ribosomal protein L37AE/L43A
MSILHIHAPEPEMRSVVAVKCPDCKKRTKMLAFFTDWYGWEQTCLKCGREFFDGYWKPLDFVRQSRQKSIAAAKKRWRDYTARIATKSA